MTSFPGRTDQEFDLNRARTVLSETGWLAGRSPQARAAILSCGRLRRFAAGQTIYRLHEPADGLYGIVEGLISILCPSDDGNIFEGHRAEPGYWIGDLALFADQRRLVSIVAVQPTVTLYLPQARLFALVSANPALFRDFYALTHANMEILLRLMANLAISNSDIRLALRLLQFAEQCTDPGGWINIAQDDLARMVAVSLPTLQRSLRRLSDQTLIEVGYGKVRVLDAVRLHEACQR